jgi:hypothetical protein
MLAAVAEIELEVSDDQSLVPPASAPLSGLQVPR